MLRNDPSSNYAIRLLSIVSIVSLISICFCLQGTTISQASGKSAASRPEVRSSYKPLEYTSIDNRSKVKWGCLEGKSFARDPSGEAVWLTSTQLMKRVVERTEPNLPMLGRGHLRGSVILQVLIDDSGKVQCARGIRGRPLAVSAVLDAIRKWVFRPYASNGKAQSVLGILNVPYDIKGHSMG